MSFCVHFNFFIKVVDSCLVYFSKAELVNFPTFLSLFSLCSPVCCHVVISSSLVPSLDKTFLLVPHLDHLGYLESGPNAKTSSECLYSLWLKTVAISKFLCGASTISI